MIIIGFLFMNLNVKFNGLNSLIIQKLRQNIENPITLCPFSPLTANLPSPDFTMQCAYSVHIFTFGSPEGPSRCCCSLLSQTWLHFPPSAEIRDHRGSIRACLTWHFLVRGWTDSFTPLCPYCHMSILQFTAFMLLVLSSFLGTMFSLLHCI